MELNIKISNIPDKAYKELWEWLQKNAIASNGMTFEPTENMEFDYSTFNEKAPQALKYVFVGATAMYGFDNAHPVNPHQSATDYDDEDQSPDRVIDEN